MLRPSLFSLTTGLDRAVRPIQGWISAFLAYPIAERMEKRQVRPKVAELRRHYRLSLGDRQALARRRLREILEFAGHNVPYYRDLFQSAGFQPDAVEKDPRRIEELPYLTKDIIREQGERMLSQPLAGIRHHSCKTGGSTGLSCVFYYDQPGADYAAAATLYGRERIGKQRFHTETHFACRFPDTPPPGKWPSREDFKCFAMNRSNIFFGRLDENGLEEIWSQLEATRPRLAHAHPSTIYALACHIEKTRGTSKAFDVFESSGELLEAHMRKKISHVLQCAVVDRYGLAEFGVIAYELHGAGTGLQVLDSEGWPEHRASETGGDEFVFTGFRNLLMPLVRYATGDKATVVEKEQGFFLQGVTGRIHDIVPINGIPHPTHHIQDILDHRVGGIQEFQIDLRGRKPILRIVSELSTDPVALTSKIESVWPGAFDIEIGNHQDMVRVGHRAKFRHVVTT
jgi:phenylacetate-CoA ligase